MKARMTSKMIKRTAAIGAAAVMAMASVPMISVFAATSTTVSVAGLQDTDDVKAYQIFAGTVVTEDGTAKLQVTGWGSGVDDTKVDYAAIKTALGATDDLTSAADVAKAIGNNTDKAEALVTWLKANALGSGTSIGTDGTALGNGYYYFGGTYNEEDLPMALNLVGAESTLTITPKVTATPTFDKEVYEDDTRNYQSAIADFSLATGHVTFKLDAHLPSDYALYDTYTLQFNDTLTGSAFSGSITNTKVWLDGVENEALTSAMQQNWAENTKSGTFTFANLKDIEGVTLDKNSIISVVYDASVSTTDADFAGDVNVFENKANLTYTKDHDDNGSGEKGETPEDKARAVTYGLDLKKWMKDSADGDLTELAGVKFTLTGEEITDGKFVKITDGVYRVATPADTTGTTTELEVASNGTLKVVGLDDGTYTLTETEAPAGYTKIDSTTITITGTLDQTNDTAGTVGSIDTLTGTVDTEGATGTNGWIVNKDDGSAKTDNRLTGSATSGLIDFGVYDAPDLTTLPETGGMGTRIFFTAGGALAVGGAIYLVSKKRSKEEE